VLVEPLEFVSFNCREAPHKISVLHVDRHPVLKCLTAADLARVRVTSHPARCVLHPCFRPRRWLMI
jgi:hypothetical protein